MVDFIAKYWIQTLFGIIVAILTYFIKHYYKLWKESQENQKNKFWDEVKIELKADNKALLQERELLLNSEDEKIKASVNKSYRIK